MTIVGDWGTTRLRLFRLDGHAVAGKLEGPGIGQLTSETLADAFLATIAPWRQEAAESGVLLCGMVGSRNGLIEVPYAACPVDLAGWAEALSPIEVGGIRVAIAPGLSAANFAGHADVMRGEETQIFGATAIDPALATGRHWLVLPGTHSKWAELVDGRIERFHTFLTGEMFALLRDRSTLTRAGTDQANPDDREAGFVDGLDRARGGLLAGLFEARAAQLIEGRSLGWALGMLSGLLVGAELAEAAALIGQAPERIILIGDPALSTFYARAAGAAQIEAVLLDGDACAIAGLGLIGGRMDNLGVMA